MLTLCRARLGIDVGSGFISIGRVVKEMDSNKEQGGETVTSLRICSTNILAVSPRSYPTYASFLTTSISSPSV